MGSVQCLPRFARRAKARGPLKALFIQPRLMANFKAILKPVWSQTAAAWGARSCEGTVFLTAQFAQVLWCSSGMASQLQLEHYSRLCSQSSFGTDCQGSGRAWLA